MLFYFSYENVIWNLSQKYVIVQPGDGENLETVLEESRSTILKEEENSNLLHTLAKEYHEIETKLKTL